MLGWGKEVNIKRQPLLFYVVQQLLEEANSIPTDLSVLNLPLIAETSLHC